MSDCVCRFGMAYDEKRTPHGAAYWRAAALSAEERAAKPVSQFDIDQAAEEAFDYELGRRAFSEGARWRESIMRPSAKAEAQ